MVNFKRPSAHDETSQMSSYTASAFETSNIEWALKIFYANQPYDSKKEDSV